MKKRPVSFDGVFGGERASRRFFDNFEKNDFFPEISRRFFGGGDLKKIEAAKNAAKNFLGTIV